MNLGLHDKTALVLGGGGGLGSAVATSLASEGAKIAVADRDAIALEGVASSIRAAGQRALPVQWDISDLSAIDPSLQIIEHHLGAIDILVNITGGPPPTPAAGQDSGLWLSQFRLMVLSVIAITDRVLLGMKTRRWGRIITSTSSGVVAPIPNLGLSNSLRASLVGWSKTLAREVARDGITVNVVVPGRVATDRVRTLDEAKATREKRSIESVIAESTTAIAIGRYGRPKEYADVVTFLASEPASYVTGSMIRIDGGLIATI